MTDDWFDMLVALLDAEARFLVIGAHALAAHGIPRGTRDLDVWIEPTRANAERVWKALEDFGAPVDSLKVTVHDLASPNLVVQFGVPPLRIDLLTGLSGVPDFVTAWNARLEHGVRDRVVPFLGRAELVATKRASGRPKDLADLHALGEADEE